MKKQASKLPGCENPTVLAVSTLDEDLRFLREILEAENWVVRGVQSCDEAVREIQRANPLVVACDDQLPDGNWKDLFRLAAGLSDPPPLVVVARHADENLWAEVLNLGGYDVLAKPFDKSEVARVMQMACRHGRRERVLRPSLR